MKGASKTYIKVVLNILTALVMILFCIFLLPRLLVFFMPFIIGWIISLIASPMVLLLENKFRIRRKAVSVIVVIVVVAAVVLILYGIGSKLVQEATGFVEELPDMWQDVEKELGQVQANLEGIYRRLPTQMQERLVALGSQLGTYFSDVIMESDIGTYTYEAVGNLAKHLPDLFIALIMTLLSAYFFVSDKGYVTACIRKYLPNSFYLRFDLIKRSLKNAVGGYFKAQLKIEVWIYFVLLIGLAILQVNYAFLIAFLIAFLDFLPVFGTGAVMLPWALIDVMGGSYKRAVGLLIIWCVSQLIRQIIQPKIVGDSIGIPAIPTLFLLYIGYRTAGLAGMLFAVPIGIIVMNLYEEGLFETTLQSLKILFAGFNRFRRLKEEDIAVVKQYEREVKESYKQEIANLKEQEKE